MLRTVQGTIGTSSATTIRPTAAVPSRHSRSQARRTAAKTTKAAATTVYSGRNIAVAPKRNPGRSQSQGVPRRAARRSQAQKNARIAAGKENIVGGSLMTSPTEWMNGG